MRRQSEMAGQTPVKKRGPWKWAAIVFGVIVTVLLGSTAFVRWDFSGGELSFIPRFSPHQFLQALGSNLGWLVVFALLSASMLPLRAIQWQRTLDKRVPFKERWHFVNIGATVHNFIPGNLGDVTRAFLLARTQKLPVLVALGSVAVCKLLELATLIILAAIALTLPFWDRMPQLVNALRAGTWVCVGLVALTIVIAHFARPVAQRLERRDRLPKVRKLLLQVDTGLGTARSVKGMLVALVFSFPPNLAAALGYGIGLQAIGVEHGILAGTLVLALIALGKGTPGLPTGPGMYFLVTSWAARALGASEQDAAAFALLTNIATGVSQWVPGLNSLAIRRIRWSELKAQTRDAAEATRSVRDETRRHRNLPEPTLAQRPTPTDR